MPEDSPELTEIAPRKPIVRDVKRMDAELFRETWGGLSAALGG